MATTAIDSLRGILNGFRSLNSKGIYTMNATETDLLRQILIEVQALSIGGGIADGSVTTPKIADLNVTTAKLADNSVTTPKIADLNVTTAKLADNSVATAKIPNGNVTPVKLSQPLTLLTPVSPSGVSVVDYSIPSWATIVVCSFSGVSLSGTENINFRLGSSGTPKATGYVGTTNIIENTLTCQVVNISTTFALLTSNAANSVHGSIVFTLIDNSSNTWAANGNFSTSAFAASFSVQGSIALDGSMDILRIFAPTNTFDAGKINVEYL